MSQPRLLLIDDERRLAELLANAARTSGFDPVITARDDEFRDEFRAWLTEHPPPVGVEFATTPEEAEALRAWHRTLARQAGRGVFTRKLTVKF